MCIKSSYPNHWLTLFFSLLAKAFKYSTNELSCGEEELRPLLFQDDIARVCNSVVAAQAGYVLVTHYDGEQVLGFQYREVLLHGGGGQEVKEGYEITARRYSHYPFIHGLQ